MNTAASRASRVPAAAGRRRSAPIRALGLVTVITIVGLWVVVTEVLHAVSPLKVPYPSGLWTTVTQLGLYVFVHIGSTLFRVFSGFLLGALVGIATGLLMSMKPAIGALLDPVIEALRPIPALAFIPFFILWMGIGDEAKILLVALGSFLTLVISTVEAVKNVPPVFVQAAQTLGAGSTTVYRTVVLPAIIPTIFSGIRLAAALSFTLAIASEFMGAQTGLGYVILVAQRTLATDAILYGIVILAITSFVTDRVIQRIGRRATRWTERIN